MSDASGQTSPEKGLVEYLSPDTLFKNLNYNQMAVVTRPVKTLYIGMQSPVDIEGNVVGKRDIIAQVTQTLANIDACLAAGGASKTDIVTIRVYVVDGQALVTAFGPVRRWWGDNPNPPPNSVLFVPKLFNPDILVGVEVVAVVAI
jgi:enamine deaminase RidA (YjgF/YER057c/UK114 family)